MHKTRQRPDRAPNLGELELEVMNLMWVRGGGDAKSVLSALDARKITLSTVQSTLERLSRKGLVERRKSGRAFDYTPALTRQQLIGLLIRGVADQVSAGAMEPVLSGFVDLVDEEDPALLEGLERMLAQRRARDAKP